jgi:O-antigen/teichoic acid export membrane protein
LEDPSSIFDIAPTGGAPRLSNLWERGIRSDFIRKVAATYATQIVVVVLGVVTTAFIARVLGPAGRGAYSVVVALGMIGMQFGNLGLHASNIFYVTRDRKLLNPLVGNSLVVSLVAGMIFAAGTWILAVIRPGWVPVRGDMLLLVWVWTAVSLACLLIQNLLMGIQDVSGYNHTELLKKIAALLLVVGVVILHRATPATVVSVSLLAIALGLLYALWRLRSASMGFPHPSLKTFRGVLGFGTRAYLVAFFGFLVLRADLLMVNHYLGAASAGYYSIASSLADYILLLPAAIAAILFPKLAGVRSRGDSMRWAKKSAAGTALILFPAVAASGLVIRGLIHLLFGNAYLPAANAYLLLTPGIFFLGVETVLVQYLNSIGIPVSVVFAWVVTCLVNIAVNIWAIPRFGINGASVVSSACYTMIFVFVLFISVVQVRRLPDVEMNVRA